MATGRVGKVALIIPKLGWISIYLKTSSHKHALLVDSSTRPQNIKNTMIYTQLMKFKESDDFICKVATTNEEISQLIETGFEYICDHNRAKFFRKRK